MTTHHDLSPPSGVAALAPPSLPSPFAEQQPVVPGVAVVQVPEVDYQPARPGDCGARYYQPAKSGDCGAPLSGDFVARNQARNQARTREES